MASTEFEWHDYMVKPFEQVPWEDAVRNLAEQAIVAIREGRLLEMGDPPCITVTAGTCYGARVVSVDSLEGPGYEIYLDSDQSCGEALIALVTHFPGIHGNSFGPAWSRRGCVCGAR